MSRCEIAFKRRDVGRSGTCVRSVTDLQPCCRRAAQPSQGAGRTGRDGRGGEGRDARRRSKGSTSIGCLLFSFPLLAPLRISPRRPIGIELHVQLPLSARQLVILGLLLAAERVPLYERAGYGNKTEKCTWTVDSLRPNRRYDLGAC